MKRKFKVEYSTFTVIAHMKFHMTISLDLDDDLEYAVEDIKNKIYDYLERHGVYEIGREQFMHYAKIYETKEVWEEMK